MADMVSSTVVQEMVSQILFGMVRKYENEESNVSRNVERLEMAHIKLQAALETSDKWQVTDASLLHWRRKLKRSAQECKDTLQKCKQRILEEEQMEQEVRNLPFPKRIAHATKSFIFSSFSRNNNSSNTSVVQRFEWFADGASEFLRFIELGGTPCHLMPFGSLIRHLFEGKKLQQKIIRGTECPLFLLWVPFSSTEYGIEASLNFIQKDSDAPEGNFFFGVTLQISESTDIIGIIVKCLSLFPLHLKFVTEIIRKRVTQLPTLDFSWVPFVDSSQREHWGKLHSFSTQWFRPDPLCCKEHGQYKFNHTSNRHMAGLPDASLEPIIKVNLQCQVPCSEYNKLRTSPSECINFLQDSPHLEVGLLYSPHSSSEDKLPANKSSAIAGIYDQEQHCMHTDITFEELKETMLAKAVYYIDKNINGTVYKLLSRPKHGTAYIQVQKSSMDTPGGRRTIRGSRKRRLVQLHDQELCGRTELAAQFLHSWGAHAPPRLQHLILDWLQNEMESQLTTPAVQGYTPTSRLDKRNREEK